MTQTGNGLFDEPGSMCYGTLKSHNIECETVKTADRWGIKLSGTGRLRP